MNYDDEAELVRYIWNHFQNLMTEFEQRVGMAAVARAKTRSGSLAVAEFMLRRHGLIGDPEVDAALEDGIDAFRLRVCRRLLAECKNDIIINRCPACSRIVRTPRAKQCFWCGHDWHELDN